MKVSNCCGDPGTRIWNTREGTEDYITYKDIGLCGECGEHCDYSEEKESRKMFKSFSELQKVLIEGQTKKEDGTN